MPGDDELELEFDPAGLKVVQLRKELGKRGLVKGGVKKELIARLRAALVQDARKRWETAKQSSQVAASPASSAGQPAPEEVDEPVAAQTTDYTVSPREEDAEHAFLKKPEAPAHSDSAGQPIPAAAPESTSSPKPLPEAAQTMDSPASHASSQAGIDLVMPPEADAETEAEPEPKPEASADVGEAIRTSDSAERAPAASSPVADVSSVSKDSISAALKGHRTTPPPSVEKPTVQEDAQSCPTHVGESGDLGTQSGAAALPVATTESEAATQHPPAPASAELSEEEQIMAAAKAARERARAREREWLAKQKARAAAAERSGQAKSSPAPPSTAREAAPSIRPSAATTLEAQPADPARTEVGPPRQQGSGAHESVESASSAASSTASTVSEVAPAAAQVGPASHGTHAQMQKVGAEPAPTASGLGALAAPPPSAPLAAAAPSFPQLPSAVCHPPAQAEPAHQGQPAVEVPPPQPPVPAVSATQAEANYVMSDKEESSDDEDEVKQKKHIPDWARGKNLESSLHAEYGTGGPDPDLIFAEISTCDLERIFDGNKRKRFRERTSSGNWLSDKLTNTERRKYRVAMGFDPVPVTGASAPATGTFK